MKCAFWAFYLAKKCSKPRRRSPASLPKLTASNRQQNFIRPDGRKANVQQIVAGGGGGVGAEGGAATACGGLRQAKFQ